MATLSFLGAARTVTGSKYLLEHQGFRMLVDCGLFQGLKELRLRNWSPPPFDPAGLDLVVLTHAHLDHTGYLPLLVRRGFKGRVLATSATRALAGVILPDSGHLQEEDARFANKRGFSKHHPAAPLYTEQDARDSLRSIDSVSFESPLQVHAAVRLRFHVAGHISGAAFVEVRLATGGSGGSEKVVLFSGDMGRPNQPILPDPRPLPECDHLLLESTYGNRDHPTDDPKDRLATILRETMGRGGTVLIPAFAVGRTQHLLYLLRELQEEGRLPADIPIFVDSPMAIEATRIVLAETEAQDGGMIAATAQGSDPLGLRGVHMAARVEESKAINNLAYPAVIISASGMAEGGRILHHLAYKLPDYRNTVLFVGYQAMGTRGRALQEGARKIRIHGVDIPARARIETLDGLSAHADRGEILSWLGAAHRPPRRVHLVHGEPEACEALAASIRKERGLNVHIPNYLEKVEIGS